MLNDSWFAMEHCKSTISKIMLVSFSKGVKVQNFCYGKEAMYFRVQLLFLSKAKFKVFVMKISFQSYWN